MIKTTNYVLSNAIIWKEAPDKKILVLDHKAPVLVSYDEVSGKKILDKEITLYIQGWRHGKLILCPENESQWKQRWKEQGKEGWRSRIEWGGLWNQGFTSFDVQTDHLDNLLDKVQLLSGWAGGASVLHLWPDRWCSCWMADHRWTAACSPALSVLALFPLLEVNSMLLSF